MQRIVFGAVVLFGALVGMAEARGATPADPRTERAQDVVMYVMPDCGYCEAARRHLRARGVSWTERDIVASPQASEEFDAMGARGTPVILVGDRRMTGFDPARMDALLAK